MDIIEIESDDSSKSTPRKRRRKPKREMRPRIEMEVSGPPPRTRSKAAPEWTTRESIVLVNEISSVEGDCLKVLSSLQKWNIIVGHCNKLGVRRTLDQCKNKWNSLIQDYNKIKQWDSKSDSDPYWVLDCETRKQFQLPENFDNDLFNAIDNHVGAQQDDTDTDAEHEDKNDLLEVIANLGCKRKRQKSISQKTEPEEEPQKSFEEVSPRACSESETSKEKHVEQEPLETHLGENEAVDPQICSESETPKAKDVEQEPLQSHLDENEEVNPQMCSQSETPEVKHVEQEHRESHLDAVNPQICLESKSQLEPRESHLVKHDEANPQMYHESATSQVQYGEQEPGGSHLDKNVEINPQICSQSEFPREQFGEKEPQRSHLDENESKSQLGVEKETPQVQYVEQDPREEIEETNHQMSVENETPRVQYSEQKPLENHLENPHEPNKSTVNVEEEIQKSPKNKSKKIERPRKKKIMGKEDEEKMAVHNLYQNAKLILDVVKGDRENGATITMSAQDSQPDFARRQGDSLIAYLGKIVSILDKFPHLIQESK